MKTICAIKMDDEHPVDTAARVLGGRDVLAKKLNVSVAAVGNWKQRGTPIEQCLKIERITRGGVTRRDLRPDDWQDIWPELAAPTVAPEVTAAGTDPGTYLGERVVFLSAERMPLRLATGDDRCVIVNEAEPAHSTGPGAGDIAQGA